MIRSGGCFKVFCVATEAFGRKAEAVELPDGPHFVAGIAVHHCVRADERKTILVLVDVMDRYLPAVCVVAQLALRAVLAPMQIGMTVLTLVRSISEFQIRVAVAACDHRVASPQGKPRLCMVEFDLVRDYLPVRRGVAGDARQIQRPMRTLSRRKRPRGLGVQDAPTEQEQHRKEK